MEYVLFALLGLVLLVSLYALHKIRLIHLSTFNIEAASGTAARESTQLYAQIQAYLDLLRLVESARPLPTHRGARAGCRAAARSEMQFGCLHGRAGALPATKWQWTCGQFGARCGVCRTDEGIVADARAGRLGNRD